MISTFFDKSINKDHVKIFAKCNVNNLTFFSKKAEENMSRCSSFVRYEFNDTVRFGQIISFLMVENEPLFVVQEFLDGIDTIDFMNFSVDYSSILRINRFADYFKVFSKNSVVKIVYDVKVLKSICVAVELDKNYILLTPTLEFEHD